MAEKIKSATIKRWETSASSSAERQKCAGAPLALLFEAPTCIPHLSDAPTRLLLLSDAPARLQRDALLFDASRRRRASCLTHMPLRRGRGRRRLLCRHRR
jgi:hypothetical protein